MWSSGADFDTSLQTSSSVWSNTNEVPACKGRWGSKQGVQVRLLKKCEVCRDGTLVSGLIDPQEGEMTSSQIQNIILNFELYSFYHLSSKVTTTQLDSSYSTDWVLMEERRQKTSRLPCTRSNITREEQKLDSVKKKKDVTFYRWAETVFLMLFYFRCFSCDHLGMLPKKKKVNRWW